MSHKKHQNVQTSEQIRILHQAKFLYLGESYRTEIFRQPEVKVMLISESFLGFEFMWMLLYFIQLTRLIAVDFKVAGSLTSAMP